MSKLRSIPTMAITLFILLQLPALGQQPIQTSPPGLEQIIAALTSDDTEDRRKARDQLEAHLSNLQLQERLTVTDDLVRRLFQPDYRTQIGIAVALSQLRQPWETRQTRQDAEAIYELMLNTKDDTMRRYLDDTIANAKGLYFDAINDYEEVGRKDEAKDKIDEVTHKFESMSKFEQSKYSSGAIFYLAQYLAKTAMLFHADSPTTKNRMLRESNEAFLRYLARAEKGEYGAPVFEADARYFMALNLVLTQQRNEAIQQLNLINERAANDDRVYVASFFYAPEGTLGLDQSLPAGRLADQTIDLMPQLIGDPIEDSRKLWQAIQRWE